MTASTSPRARLAGRSSAPSRDRRRSIVDRAFRGLSLAAAITGIIPLFAIIAYVTINGIQALNLDLVTKAPQGAGRRRRGGRARSSARSRWSGSRR